MKNISQFNDRLLETIERQCTIFELYRRLCQSEHIEEDDFRHIIGDRQYYRLPPVPTIWFKDPNSRDYVNNLQLNGMWTASSATTKPSYVWRTPRDIEVMRGYYLDCFQGFPSGPSGSTVIFSPSPEFLKSKKVTQRFDLRDGRPLILQAVTVHDAARELYRDPVYTAKLNIPKTIIANKAPRLYRMLFGTDAPRGPVLDNISKDRLEEILRKAEQSGDPVTLAASVLLLYPTMEGYFSPGDFNLKDNAYITTGAGGWSGRKGTQRGKPIDKLEYVKIMCNILGIPLHEAADHIQDIYGFTESPGAYGGRWDNNRGDFVFEVPDSLRVYAVHPDTKKPVGKGEKGLFTVVSPQGVEGYIGAVVRHDDVVEGVSFKKDGSLKEFTGIGRLGDDAGEAVGCGYIMAEGVQ